MLQSIREMSKSWIFKSLMVLLVVSFAIWGIGDMFRGNPALRTVASVGKIKIPVQSLEARFQAGLPEARALFGPDMTVTQARQMGVLDRTLRLMMEEYAFDQDAQRLGINVSHDMIVEKIAAQKAFRMADGGFNAQMWKEALRKAGLTEESFFDLELRDTGRQTIFGVVASNSRAPKIMTDTLYQARGAKRLLEVVTLRNDSVKDLTPATDDLLQAFYNTHEDQFVAPEYRGLTIAQLSGADITKEVTVTDADIQAAYDSRSEEMVKPETRDMIQIVLQDEAKAKSIAETAQALHDLSQAAKAKSVTPIAMNKIEEKAILPELFTTVFALEEGQVSQAVKSSMGWHVVQLKKINAGGKQSFEQVKEDLRQSLQAERAGDMIAKTINQLDDALAGGQSLEDLADGLKLHLTRYASLDAQGKQTDGKDPKEPLPAKEITLKAAWSLAAGETGQVLDDGAGNYYVARVDQITPSQTLPFAEAKGQVLVAWTQEQLAAKAATAAEEIAKQLREGKTATSFASRPGIDVRLSKPISLLGDNDKDVPQPLLPQIFQMKVGDVTTATRDGKQYVIRLADIVPVDPNKPEASRLKIVQDLKENMPHSFLEQYSAYLHTLFPQKINADLLNSLKSQGG